MRRVSTDGRHTVLRQASVLVLTVSAISLAEGGKSPQTRSSTVAPGATSMPRSEDTPNLRQIRVAVFDLDVPKEIDIQAGALTDRINTILAGLPKVTIVNRDQIKHVAEEQKMSLSGLVATSSAAKLGKMLSAQYIIAGRASMIGQTHYLVLKIVDVETTVQTTVSAKAPVQDGIGAVVDRIAKLLSDTIRGLQRPLAAESDRVLDELRTLAAPLARKVFLIDVSEEHVNRPLRDPAAQMAVAQRLRSLGMSVIIPKQPVAGWKDALLQTGKYGDEKVDFLMEGEGTSAFAAQIQGLMSCRARVELRLVAVPGRTIKVSDRGVAAGADLVEALAAKAALEEAGVQACDAVVRRLCGGEAK